jgi:hypothetical protein
MRGAHPQPGVQLKKAHQQVTTGSAGRSGIPCTMVLTVSFVLSPAIGLFVTVIGENPSANLIPASRNQDHTTSPSASGAFVSRAAASIVSRFPRFVTIAIRPSFTEAGWRQREVFRHHPASARDCDRITRRAICA